VTQESTATWEAASLNARMKQHVLQWTFWTSVAIFRRLIIYGWAHMLDNQWPEPGIGGPALWNFSFGRPRIALLSPKENGGLHTVRPSRTPSMRTHRVGSWGPAWIYV